MWASKLLFWKKCVDFKTWPALEAADWWPLQLGAPVSILVVSTLRKCERWGLCTHHHFVETSQTKLIFFYFIFFHSTAVGEGCVCVY